MTQADAAELLNVSQRTYADYELGLVRIPVDCLARLAYHYNTSMDYITAICKDGKIDESYINDLTK
jgi:transcriptional regulator with XRE-family HTH domain